MVRGSEVDAPIIVDCPVNLECRLKQEVPLGTHSWLIGEILEVHVNDDCLSEGKVDALTLDPLIFLTSQQSYFGLGKKVAKAFSIGKSLRR